MPSGDGYKVYVRIWKRHEASISVREHEIENMPISAKTTSSLVIFPTQADTTCPDLSVMMMMMCLNNKQTEQVSLWPCLPIIIVTICSVNFKRHLIEG